MYDRILLPTDGSDAAERARDVAVDVAAAHDAELHVLYVADSNQPSNARLRAEITDVLVEEGEDVVDAAAEAARERGVATETAVVQGGPSNAIVDYVEDRGTELVVMATRGERGVGELLLGTVTERVVRESPVPVLTVPPDGETAAYPPGDVLVALDESDGAESALLAAADLAADVGARLHLLTVLEADLLAFGSDAAVEDEYRETVREHLGDAAARVRERGVEDVETEVRRGGVDETVTAYARERSVDLIAIGTHGEAGLRRRLLGSTTSNVVRQSSVPVLTVRADEGG